MRQKAAIPINASIGIRFRRCHTAHPKIESNYYGRGVTHSISGKAGWQAVNHDNRGEMLPVLGVVQADELLGDVARKGKKEERS